MNEPNIIWCPYCHAEWDLLPGEYETLKEHGSVMICPLCKNEMEILAVHTDQDGILVVSDPDEWALLPG